jgi:tyrosyl-tRNA synthetase
MSKSYGNAIGIHEPPAEMYGKIMSISDELMWRFYTLLTDLRTSEIEALQADVAEGRLHPMQAKKNLALAITADFHSPSEAEAAAQSWATQFQQRGVADDAPEVAIDSTSEGLLDAATGDIRIPKLLVLAGLAPSTGEATRKIAENAVSLNSDKFTTRTLPRSLFTGPAVLRLGKRQVRITLT